MIPLPLLDAHHPLVRVMPLHALAYSASFLPLQGRDDVQAIPDPLQRLVQLLQRQILPPRQEGAQCVFGEARRLTERAPRRELPRIKSSNSER